MATPFSFQEERHISYVHGIKLFIFGVDVSTYLTSDIDLTQSDRNGTNICTFTLSNAGQIFEMTEKNLNTSDVNKGFNSVLMSSFDGQYSEQAKKEIYLRKTNPKLQIQHEVAAFGPVEGPSIISDTSRTGQLLKTNRNASNTISTSTDRFPFTLGSLVFHKYDPVRVFVLNPFKEPGRVSDQGGADTQEWTCVFTGYIDTKPYTQDYITGNSFVNISCQDIRMLMQGMRTQVNPSTVTGNDNVVAFRDASKKKTVPDQMDIGLFNDLISPTRQISHVLAGKGFSSTMKFLLFGIESPAPTTSTTDTTSRTSLGAVGRLKNTNPVYFDVKNRKDTLEKWNNTIIFGDKGTYLSANEVQTIGSETYPGGKHAPDVASVRYLYPAAGGPLSNLVEYNYESPPNAKADWSSRLELIIGVCKAIDYQFYVSGLGDLIFEFPMYDFSPSDYGESYNSLYSFELHNTNSNINDEGGEPISGLVVTSNVLQGEQSRGNPGSGDASQTANAVQLIRTVFSNVLASRIGVHMETMHIPGVKDQNQLGRLGMIEFNKRLANYDRFDMSVSYRPYITVNRPIYNKTKARIGITNSVKYQWRIREDAELNLSLSYTRKQEKDGKFRFITGGEATPISYNTIYSPSEVYVPKQGVNISAKTDGVPQSTPSQKPKEPTNGEQ
jgi:hypothetical protein